MGLWDSLGSVFLGGLGKSTNPSDYAVNNPQQGAINGLMQQGAPLVNPMAQEQFRQQQLLQAQQLQRIASGQAQGAGELAVQRQVANAQAAQQAQARMARGGMNAGLAMRNAANNQATIGLGGAGQSQQAALSDQQMAQGQLAGVLGQGRGQDIGLATTNAQLQQNQYGQNLGALTSLNGQDLQAQNAAMGATLGQQGILGGLINTAGTVVAAGMKQPGGGGAPVASDRRLKTAINEDAGDEVDEMLDRLQAKSYRYKDEQKYGEGRRLGLMAQDLAKSKAGSAVVDDGPDGLALDPGKAISAALAASARLHERVKKLEKTA